MAVPLALLAAALFALGTVLQQREAMREPDSEALSGGFLLRLARRPVWLAGVAADGLGYGAQAAALGFGRLIIVQPVLAIMVVFSLPLGAKLSGQRIGRREVIAAVAVTAGLALFLVLANPTGGRDDAPAGEWLLTGGAVAAVCGVLIVASLGRRPSLRAALLGTATGILWGVAAAITLATVKQLDEGIVHLLTDWHLYGLIVIGAISLLLSQASLQAGALAPAIATASIFDPVASFILGVTLLQESLHETTAGAAAAVAALAVAMAGVYALASAEGAPESAPATARPPARR